MKADTYIEFRDIKHLLHDIVLLLASHIVETSQDAEIKALAASLKARSANLKTSFPAATGSTPPQ